MGRQVESWGMKDTESRFIYANKTVILDSCLPINFNIEGKLASECPASWNEYADTFDKYDQIALKLAKPMLYISTYTTWKYKENISESSFIKHIPYYNQNKITGTIFHAKKIHPLLVSKYFFKQPTTFSFLTNHPPNNSFTTEELNVLFFAMKLMSNQEIALRLGTYSCVVEQIIQQIYRKIDIYSRKQLRDYGIAEGFDNYIPPFLLKGLL
ncbi:helix-turn-helix transcriptional regulator [Candidatus Arsenophonus triatominarum]|uniref:helix-turn-helix transcriptional regulator n=1 Tax=Candidatus Arsenophonus triatominarum TaxID=57911 RepID=UPI000A620FEF|nr:hypothetical protein [Candidatus Arsenophonus triatominarum]